MMTENDWLTSDDPIAMASFIAPQATPRKSRLYWCGGCRGIWNLFYHQASRDSVEIAERFADSEADSEQLRYAYWAAEVPTFGLSLQPSFWRKHTPEGELPDDVRELVARGILDETNLVQDKGPANPREWTRAQTAAHWAEFCSSPSARISNPDDYSRRHFPFADWPGGWLFRDIFGNPFRPAAFDPRWRTSDVLGLAHAIYRRASFRADADSG